MPRIGFLLSKERKKLRAGERAHRPHCFSEYQNSVFFVTPRGEDRQTPLVALLEDPRFISQYPNICLVNMSRISIALRTLLSISVVTVSILSWCFLVQNSGTLKPLRSITQTASEIAPRENASIAFPLNNDAGIETRNYTIPGCPCERTGFALDSLLSRRSEARARPEDFPEWFLKKFSFEGQSTCSDYATQRGGGQRVVSYVYYAKAGRSVRGSIGYKKYLSQLYSTVDVIGRVYPGWVVRIHHNVTTEDEVGMAELCRIYCDHDYVDLCHAHDLPGLGNMNERRLTGMMWRFAVMGDPTVQTFLSRDTDSWVLDREVAAVKEWLASNRTFHVVHDHPRHGPVILGGFWGAHNKDLRTMQDLRDKMYSKAKTEQYGQDQKLLKNILWPYASTSVLNHASFTCQRMLKEHGPAVPFPTQREGGRYCGWGTYKVAEARLVAKTVCPEECRPKDHKDWTRC
ncbi:uncharacterized protein LOC119582472 isoform X2 [Penaeus monodon]|uniref:uncharacterized protein LOC119582472 isoform X2 n=2 Tax=Penaeus monodon TaxID=6687 RepID=UPI0018A76815|nr:uncharacterized protein LOC119582472 isoform X2 [Penaeus monodon]